MTLDEKIDGLVTKMATKIAAETESLIARFMMETGIPASQIEICYGPDYNEPGVSIIWVRRKKP